MRSIFIAILNAAALVVFAVACQTTPEDQAPAKVEDRTGPGGKPGAQSQAVQPPKVAAVDVTGPRGAAAQGALKDPASILSKRSVYFEYDKYDVKDEFRPLVEAHAKYLRENPAARMLIQGNADERGSREYNLALGQKRSDSVKRMLVLLGARDAQLESVSLGEEKPQCAEHNEQCWSKNRRGDMLYGGEY